MIKEKRQNKKFTQEEMANKLEISLRQYARIDKGEDLPRRDVLRKIIDVLELSDQEIGEYIREIVNG